MIKTKRIFLVIMIAILAALMISQSLMLSKSATTTSAGANIQAPPLTPTTNYGDKMQYDWPEGGHDEGNTGYNTGPAPDKANILWKTTVSGAGIISVFDGKAFLVQGAIIGTGYGAAVIAYDAFTGAKVWTAQCPLPMKSVAGVYRIDSTYMLGFDVGFMTVIRISDGTVMWTENITYGSAIPGSASYFAGRYSESMKTYFTTWWDNSTNTAAIVAFNLANPTTAAPMAWLCKVDQPMELLCSGDGLIFAGSTEATVIAINGTSGQIVWQSNTGGGIIQQNAMYYNHCLYTSAVTWQLTCFNGSTGVVNWQVNKGTRAFSAYRGAAGMGMIFDATDELDPYGTVRAWDANTGAELWRQPAYFNIHYATMACADGKLYSTICDQGAGAHTGTLIMPGYTFACFDVYTGAELWRLSNVNMAQPSIAYGNLYGLAGSTLYCIGGDPADWTNGLQGTVANGRVAVGQQGPSDISNPTWVYNTGADVSSSPAVVNGKVYVGSHDMNWYCLDAFTGAKIWNTTIGAYVRTSAAVVNSKVFTGADDGYFYCLDANTGAKLWKTSAGGAFPNMLDAIEYQSRSSPIVVNSKVYCGSLDGKVYCLSVDDGRVLSTYTTGSPIFGSPTYSNGTIYIASTDFALYALNENDLTLKWKSISLTMDMTIPDARSKFTVDATPAVGGGLVYIGAGIYNGISIAGVNYTAQGMSTPTGSGWGGAMRMMAFNATTGASVWNVTRTGNTPLHIPVYWNGQLYEPEYFYVASANASKPNSGKITLGDFGLGASTPRAAQNRTWAQWLGYQVSSSVAYADDLTGGKVYIGSDIGSLYCLSAINGSTISVFAAGANIPSNPAIWDGKLYATAVSGAIYCFDDSPKVDFTIAAESNKGETMWNNETLNIAGRLVANPEMMQYDYSSNSYLPVDSKDHPGLPNATVIISMTKPDGSSQNVTCVTDNQGYFTVQTNLKEAGTWGWLAFYAGQRTTGITYNPTYSHWNNLNVIAAPVEPTPIATATPTVAPTQTATVTASPEATATPVTNAGLSMENIAIIAVVAIVIVIVALLAFFMVKRRKTKAA